MEISVFEKTDLESLPALQPEGWGDICPGFHFYTSVPFCFPLKAVIHDKMVGTGVAIIHHDVAWLAHIIVHPDYRNKGIGATMTRTLIDLVQTKSCNTIYLIATDLGATVYEKAGFVTETEYVFFKEIKPTSTWQLNENIIPFNNNHKDGIARIDKEISKEDRMFHIEHYLSDGYVYLNNKSVEGFYLPSFGDGLILANTTEAGIELMKYRLLTRDNAVFPVDNKSALEFCKQCDFKEARRAKRMRLGIQRDWNPSGIYNRIGGNLG